jgi:hypothetical protein
MLRVIEWRSEEVETPFATVREKRRRWKEVGKTEWEGTNGAGGRAHPKYDLPDIQRGSGMVSLKVPVM